MDPRFCRVWDGEAQTETHPDPPQQSLGDKSKHPPPLSHWHISNVFLQGNVGCSSCGDFFTFVRRWGRRFTPFLLNFYFVVSKRMPASPLWCKNLPGIIPPRGGLYPSGGGGWKSKPNPILKNKDTFSTNPVKFDQGRRLT